MAAGRGGFEYEVISKYDENIRVEAVMGRRSCIF